MLGPAWANHTGTKNAFSIHPHYRHTVPSCGRACWNMYIYIYNIRRLICGRACWNKYPSTIVGRGCWTSQTWADHIDAKSVPCQHCENIRAIHPHYRHRAPGCSRACWTKYISVDRYAAERVGMHHCRPQVFASSSSHIRPPRMHKNIHTYIHVNY